MPRAGLGWLGSAAGEKSPPDGRGVSRGATPGCQGWYPWLPRAGLGRLGSAARETSPPDRRGVSRGATPGYQVWGIWKKAHLIKVPLIKVKLIKVTLLMVTFSKVTKRTHFCIAFDVLCENFV